MKSNRVRGTVDRHRRRRRRRRRRRADIVSAYVSRNDRTSLRVSLTRFLLALLQVSAPLDSNLATNEEANVVAV